ncbi:hypothetical protein ZIOFF_023808 [Zingiber officinale]|uniref:Uncharacterized protein n=1 Tax=Zingiber officinale TaxID=94328 RepID=A0A8J5GXB5_ZINOF|nr:hypothetical protein ZIOFF_023808 [Zingiber officinale]
MASGSKASLVVAASMAAVEALKDQAGLCRWNYALRSLHHRAKRSITEVSAQQTKRPSRGQAEGAAERDGSKRTEETMSRIIYWDAWGPKLWKSFSEDEDRPEKPRQFGVTEIRGPDHCLVGRQAFENLINTVMTEKRSTVAMLHKEILESMGEFVDGLKFSGGSHSLMPNDFIKEITDLAHKHNIYVSTGDWAEHLLRKGSSSFKHYVEECKRLGFDTIELNAGSLKLPEDVLLRFIRLIKSNGLKAKPQFSINFEKSDIPVPGHRAFGAYISPVPESSELVEDVDLLIRRAERCLEAGADMIMIDADDVCKHAESLRSDIVAKIIGRLGLQKTMFEASNDKTSEWFVKRYGPRVLLTTIAHPERLMDP